MFQLLFPTQVIRADDVAKAMVDIAIRKGVGTETVILENRDIRTKADPNAP